MLEVQVLALVLSCQALQPKLVCLEYASALRAKDEQRMCQTVVIPQVPATDDRLCSSQDLLRSIVALHVAEYSLDEKCRKRFGRSLDECLPDGSFMTEGYLQRWLSCILISRSVRTPTGIEIELNGAVPRLTKQRLKNSNSRWVLTHMPTADEEDLVATLNQPLFLNLSFVHALQFAAFLRSLEARISDSEGTGLSSFDEVKSALYDALGKAAGEPHRE